MVKTTVIASGLTFPECPRWLQDELWFVDGPAVKRIDAGGSLSTHAVIDCPLLIGLAAVPDGGWLTADAVGRRVWKVDEQGAVTLFADLSDETPFMINEVMLIADGSLIVSDIGFDALNGGEPKAARLIRVAPDGSAGRTGSPMLFANGMVSAGDGTELFVAETFGGRIWRYEVSGSEGLNAGYPIAHDCHGIDGLACASNSTFWYANHQTGDVVHVSASGEKLSRISSGFNCATSCVLDDGCSHIFITAVSEMPSGKIPLKNGDGVIISVILKEQYW